MSTVWLVCHYYFASIQVHHLSCPSLAWMAWLVTQLVSGIKTTQLIMKKIMSQWNTMITEKDAQLLLWYILGLVLLGILLTYCRHNTSAIKYNVIVELSMQNLVELCLIVPEILVWLLPKCFFWAMAHAKSVLDKTVRVIVEIWTMNIFLQVVHKSSYSCFVCIIYV